MPQHFPNLNSFCCIKTRDNKKIHTYVYLQIKSVTDTWQIH